MLRPAVTLRKDLARSIRSGHPWVYRDALAGRPALVDGTLVEVRAKDGKRLATGFWDSESPIAVRILARDKFEALEPLLRERLDAALSRRLERIEPSLTNAFRWVHGEADRLVPASGSE